MSGLPFCAHRSLLEPVRISNPFVTYFEAECDAVDLQAKTAACTSTFTFSDGRRPAFEVTDGHGHAACSHTWSCSLPVVTRSYTENCIKLVCTELIS